MARSREKQMKNSAETTQKERTEWNEIFLVNIEQTSLNLFKSFFIIALVIS